MENNKSGRYVFDKKTGKVIKVSDKVPSLSNHNHDCGHCCGCGCEHH